jgi:hypothetical protein
MLELSSPWSFGVGRMQNTVRGGDLDLGVRRDEEGVKLGVGSAL